MTRGPEETRRARLGSTGVTITPVGLGTFNYRQIDEPAVVSAIKRAAALGISWIDTAPAYRAGGAEELVGRTLRSMPTEERPLVFTKCGLIVHRDGMRCIGDPAATRREAERSLRLLGVEVLDLLQLHWPPNDSTTIEEAWGGLVALREEGLARFVGVSNFDPPQLDRCEQIAHVDTVQLPFSMLARDAAQSAGWARIHGTGVLAYGSMARGVLTDAFTRVRVNALANNDWRRGTDDFTAPLLERNLALVQALTPIAARLGSSVAALAVAWVLSWPGVTAVVAGASRPDQVDDWLGATRLALGTAELEEIADAIRDTSAGSGPITSS